MDALPGFSGRWVSPFYLHLLHANFTNVLVVEHPSEQRIAFMSEFRRAVADVEVAMARLLLEQQEWRARLTGSWYCALRRFRECRELIGELLVESKLCFAGQGYCVALATMADDDSAAHLERYLDTWLPQTDKFYDQAWAIPALIWIDERLGTRRAAPYLRAGGLWDRWAAVRLRHEEQPLREMKLKFDEALRTAIEWFAAG